jgi:chemosensory pili system protein ChpA (sensor histidine kinase/response regulator)
VSDGLLTVLVVEDEIDGREVVTELLRHFDIVADPVATAEEAVQQLAEADYRGVIIDLHLPGMDGWQLLEHIRGNPATADLPCIAVTAYHTSAVRHDALAAGFNAYFAKPFDDMGFVREVSEIIGG